MPSDTLGIKKSIPSSKVILGSLVLILVNALIIYLISNRMQNTSATFLFLTIVAVLFAEALLFLMFSMLFRMDYFELVLIGDVIVRGIFWMIVGIFQLLGQFGNA